MSKKIYPNSPCPCGSGKKYKYCCGKNDSLNLLDYRRSPLHIDEFMCARLTEDFSVFYSTINYFLLENGFNYCSDNAAEFDKKFKEGKLIEIAEKNELGILGSNEYLWIKDSMPNYQGGEPKTQEDVISLDKKGIICREGHQVELLHCYFMTFLNGRFEDYFYLPEERWTKDQEFGPLGHRGYDFLLAMTLYLELQLGIHLYLDKYKLDGWRDLYEKDVLDYFAIQDYEISDGLLFLLKDYKDVLTKIGNRYSWRDELRLYNMIGAISDEEYIGYLSMIHDSELSVNYLDYLRFLVPTICFHDMNSSLKSSASVPQCDFWKYLVGLHSVQRLFEDKNDKDEETHVKLNISDDEFFSESVEQLQNSNFKSAFYSLNKQDLYHRAVFYLADDYLGNLKSLWNKDIDYDDFPKIVTARLIEGEGENHRLVNPARKSYLLYNLKERRPRLEIYHTINGVMFDLYNSFLDPSNTEFIGRYPILPWLSSGKEDTYHINQSFEVLTYEALYSEDIIVRQQYLGMELRLTEIPVTCVEEFLIPDIYYVWDKQQKLLKEVEKQNDELNKLNERLKRQIKLNQELVRNLSHSSANYLNPEKLAETGVVLQDAEQDNPGVDELHMEGHSLLWQSAQESYITRQLSSLVWRCSGDENYLLEQICGGLADDGGVDITEPVGFALESLLSRILFRKHDERVSSIRMKLNKSEEEWQSMQYSFARDILASDDEEGGIIFQWWNHYIGELDIIVSDYWKSEIHILPRKPFFDLIAEIMTELLLNAMSHGDLFQKIKIEFGHVEGRIKGMPMWGIILCENIIGKEYTGGKQEGIKTLNEMLLLLNDEEKGIQTYKSDDTFYTKIWLKGKYLLPL